MSFVVGAITLALVLSVSSERFPSIADLRDTPKGLMIGGALGAVYVTSVLLIIPRIGVANTLVAVVVGQVVVALALDHFGVLGLPIRPVTLTRAFGAGTVVLGLYLVQR